VTTTPVIMASAGCPVTLKGCAPAAGRVRRSRRHHRADPADQDFGMAGRRHAGDIHDILDADRNPVQRNTAPSVSRREALGGVQVVASRMVSIALVPNGLPGPDALLDRIECSKLRRNTLQN
jgi:hypothetical protein